MNCVKVGFVLTGHGRYCALLSGEKNINLEKQKMVLTAQHIVFSIMWIPAFAGMTASGKAETIPGVLNTAELNNIQTVIERSQEGFFQHFAISCLGF